MSLARATVSLPPHPPAPRMGNPVAAYDPGVGLPSFTLFYFNLLIFNLNVFHTSCLSPSRNRKQHREVHRQQTGGDRN